MKIGFVRHPKEWWSVFCSRWMIILICGCALIKRSTASMNHADWMAELPDELLNVPLSGIAIPGSHDSASYSLNMTYALAPDTPEKVLDIVKLSQGMQGVDGFVRSKIYRWSVTQSVNITQQLQLGIRYFDLRVFYKEKEDRFSTYHTMTGAPLEVILAQIVTFQQRHPREVLLLDINHLHVLTKNGMHKLIMLLQKTFGDRMCTNKTTQISLSELWKEGKNAIIFLRMFQKLGKLIEMPDFVWFDNQLLSPFDKAKFAYFKSWLKFLSNGYEHRPQNDTFYVTQGIMQPNWFGIAASSLFSIGSLETWTSDAATKALVKWLPICRRGTDGINIVIADFIEKHNFTETVLSLNLQKGLASCSSDLHPHKLLFHTLYLVVVFFVLKENLTR